MLVLSFDQSLASSGYCLMDENENILHVGTIKTNPKKENHYRLLDIYNNITDIIKNNNPDIIAIEESYFRSNIKTLKSLNTVRGIIELAAAQNDIKLEVRSTTECRKIVLGNGSTKKEEVFEYIKERYKDVDFANTDMTDAALIALACIKNIKKAGVISGEEAQTTRRVVGNRGTSNRTQKRKQKSDRGTNKEI